MFSWFKTWRLPPRLFAPNNPAVPPKDPVAERLEQRRARSSAAQARVRAARELPNRRAAEDICEEVLGLIDSRLPPPPAMVCCASGPCACRKYGCPISYDDRRGMWCHPVGKRLPGNDELDWQVQLEALEQMTRPASLAAIAEGTGELAVGDAALGRITGHKELLTIAMRAHLKAIGARAMKKLLAQGWQPANVREYRRFFDHVGWPHSETPGIHPGFCSTCMEPCEEEMGYDGGDYYGGLGERGPFWSCGCYHPKSRMTDQELLTMFRSGSCVARGTDGAYVTLRIPIPQPVPSERGGA